MFTRLHQNKDWNL